MTKIIVPVSGGKDSQACLKMAVLEHGAENVTGLFCDTKFEHPLTYKHIETMRDLYGARIDTVCGGDVLSSCLENKRFPSGTGRFCTDKLKIRETRIYLKSHAETIGAAQVWYGMRTDESAERAKRYQYRDPDDLHDPHDVIANYPKYLGKMGIMFRLPIVDWTEKEVLDYLAGEQNPLYSQGFKRVGCFPCLASGDKWKIKAFEHDGFGKSQQIKVKLVEEETGKSVYTSGIGFKYDNDMQGCLICAI